MANEVKMLFIEQPEYGKETYLGDGLYASHNGHQIKLRAPRGDEDHVVFLEPKVLQNFIEWLDNEEPGNGGN